MDGINDILSSLSDEDIENLKSAAAELFGSQPQESEARRLRERPIYQSCSTTLR